MAMDRPRYSITLDQELFQRVEDFRFENRYQTRNEATVQLIRLGLEQIDRQRLSLRRGGLPRAPVGTQRTAACRAPGREYVKTAALPIGKGGRSLHRPA